MNGFHFRRREEGPNDPKLSDCGARRAGCGVSDREDDRERERVSRRRRVERGKAASVTRGAVRCSAWFGVRVELSLSLRG